MRALQAAWQVLPPAAVSLHRISAALGLKPQVPSVARTAEEAMHEAAAAGLPLVHGRPDDPMLDFLDLPTP